MGRLLKLELENFKSYGGTQICGPFEDFTCIVGPNGSGKSNLMDAISFVLGVQSRQLRSSNLKELIFRKDEQSLPARLARVELTYQLSPQEKHLSLNDDPNISFCRTINAIGTSSYKLQGQNVTFEEYERALRKIGVIVKARNFLVFQGDVESIASKSPADLTKLIEHICEADLLASDYDALRKSKTEAEEATVFTMQKKKIFLSQFKEVKQQKEEADLYQKKSEALKTTRTDYVLWKVWRNANKLSLHGTALGIQIYLSFYFLDFYILKHNDLCLIILVGLKEELISASEEDKRLVSEIGSVKRNILGIGGSSHAQELKVRNLKEEIKKVQASLTSNLNRQKIVQKRIKDSQKNHEKVTQDIADQKLRKDKLASFIEESHRKLETCKAQIAELPVKKMHMSPNDVRVYGELKELAASKTSSQRAKLNTLEYERHGFVHQKSVLEAQHESLDGDLKFVDGAIQDTESNLTSLITEEATANSVLEKLTAEKGRIQEKLKRDQLQLERLSVELQETQDVLRNAGDDNRRGKYEQRLTDALSTIQAIYKGVHGRLIDLCRPIQKKYANAISVAAGKLMDAVVVDNREVASECIQYLKEQRIGVCTFLPLDSLSYNPVPERHRSFGSNFKPCIDLVDCNDIFKPAVAYALDAALVCDSLENARNLCYQRGEQVKVVTLQGHIIHRSGSMTGGVAKDSCDRWEEKEIEKLRQKKVDLECKISALRDDLSNRDSILELESRQRQIQTRQKYLQLEIANKKEKLHSLAEQKEMKLQRLKMITTSIKDFSMAEQTAKTTASSIKEEIDFIEKEIFRDFSKSLGIDNFLQYEAEMSSKSQDLLEQYNKLSKTVASSTAQLQYENNKNFSEIIIRLEESLSKLRAEAEVLENDEHELGTSIEKLSNLLSKEISNGDVFSSERSRLTSDLKALTLAKTEINKKKENLAKNISSEELSIERLQSDIKEILRQALVDEVEIPTSRR